MYQYERLKRRAWAGDDEGVQESSGKVAEHALRASQHLAGQLMKALDEEIRDVPAELRKLEQLPSAEVRDSIRIVIPRVVGALYTLRNKRRGGHTASEVDPSRSDALLSERIADWLMAEFFRLGNDLPPDQAEAAVAALILRRIPVVYRAGDYRRVLKEDLDPENEVLVLLYSESRGATISELVEWTNFPRSSLSRYVSSLERKRLVRTETEGRLKRAHILPTGASLVEKEGWLRPE